ncbi:hypothetical protein PEX1_105780 [Penicillium expansum]|uniref:Uncharacterized protein n=1 Tax=Penicillium expansum TaxID=27334 RepID=A0A0A2JYY2_PENEN|nr:hypothetical protein PEX2_088110 [Penicillium expansum]KGO35953.1 hypothetical protein PEXP_037410 [Penicillium expansum]KGO60629.1 hypothetical protein PEX2_088110 [Penicillium expansum]KGO73274.1 hypothetical protein PEX1_105780 [Penicillium expansum]
MVWLAYWTQTLSSYFHLTSSSTFPKGVINSRVFGATFSPEKPILSVIESASLTNLPHLSAISMSLTLCTRMFAQRSF